MRTSRLGFGEIILTIARLENMFFNIFYSYIIKQMQTKRLFIIFTHKNKPLLKKVYIQNIRNNVVS